jgi:hypothetical protein
MAEPKPPTRRASPPPTADGSRDAFDIWLRACLRRVHDAVAAEPVPEPLRRLAAGANEPQARAQPAVGRRAGPGRGLGRRSHTAGGNAVGQTPHRRDPVAGR